MQVLSLLARGADFPQIAKRHGLPVATARAHLRDAMTTLGAANATHAVTLAIAAGHLPADVANPQEQEPCSDRRSA
ncbi:LuxR C-terminal-related transcriptional regulator [Kitasatospora sp. NBC_01302]|uniref:LuxR C-terminal-related transcriptional regulator n=1 Tax=Kitasatospora sp. NBC_01302 TaxID=2903575 RepID=UPI002E1451EF|nr:LuxR C-terminal-related transcriptional regulator [Kitasatospora sp. NBC_01302]